MMKTDFANGEFVEWAFGLFGEIPIRGDYERHIHVAEYEGSYGTAGYVMTINGSPPKATILVELSSNELVALRDGRVRRGHGYVGGPAITYERYWQAVEWLRTFGAEL